MGRIRTVKPELFLHEDLYKLEKSSKLPVRLAFIGLFTMCDRLGRFRWKPKQLKLAVMPWDRLDFERVLDALAQGGYLLKYEVSGEMYGCVPKWKLHQVIGPRERKSSFPPPPCICTEGAVNLQCCAHDGIGREGNRKGIGTGNGTGREGEQGTGTVPPRSLEQLIAEANARGGADA